MRCPFFLLDELLRRGDARRRGRRSIWGSLGTWAMNDGSCPSPFYLTVPFLRWPAPPLLRFPFLVHTLHYQPDPTKGKRETGRQPRGHKPASVVRHRAAELRSDGERRREGRSGRTTCLLASSPSRSAAIHTQEAQAHGETRKTYRIAKAMSNTMEEVHLRIEALGQTPLLLRFLHFPYETISLARASYR